MSIEYIHKYGINPTRREIYLHSIDSLDGDPGIEYQMAMKFIKNLHILECKSKEPIFIHMTSIGGCWEDGMTIFDAIKSCRCPITILGYGDIASMGTVIIQSADLRLLMPNACFMIHYGDAWYEGASQGMKAWSDLNDQCNEKMFDIYAEVCAESRDIDRDTIRQQIVSNVKEKIEWFLTPHEAVKLGLVDEVFE